MTSGNCSHLPAQESFQRALALHQAGQLVQARTLYEEVLAAQPRHADAVNLLGAIALQTRDMQRAAQLFAVASEIDPQNVVAHCNRGLALYQLGELNAALTSYDHAIALNGDVAEAHFHRGRVLCGLRQFDVALSSFQRAIEIDPDNAEAHLRSAFVLQAQHLFDAAIAACDRATEILPDYEEAHLVRAGLWHELHRWNAALAGYDQAIALGMDLPQVHSQRGMVLAELKQFDAALASFDRAIVLKPEYAEAYCNRGIMRIVMRRWELALADLDQAVRLKADFAEAYHNRGIVLAALKQFDSALASYDQAVALKPEHPASHFARGIALNCLNRSPEALASLERALQLAPDYAEAYIERGTTLKRLGHQDLAVASYERANVLKPDHDWLQGLCVHERLYLCDWSNLSAEIASLSVNVERGAKAVMPFHLLTLIDSPLLQRRAAQTYAEHKNPSQLAPTLIRRRPQGERIRIGYFSADFFNHATAYLMAQIFERHDRARFHVVGFSFGPEVGDEMSKRLSSAFDDFANVRARSDQEVAELSRERQIDIAVDLKGFTSHSRPEIFAHRAAPIQVSYQGYPGTMGASYIDYIMGDRTVIPEQSREHFTERVAYLPDSYFANGADLSFRQTMHSRSELGLPARGFVFCCFNNTYKIMPATFDSWMRVLREVPGSVLWLLQDGEVAARNLRNEARSRGVDEERLIFAARTTVSEHLPRHAAADLFLDTLPCNAHTTAFDALSMGLPLLTRAGHSFASRVAASLLNAVGLPELITHDEDHYEALAVALANDPERLARIRAELQNRRLTAPLFQPQLLTRHLEQAYTLMYQRYRQDLPPQDLEIHA